MNKGVALLILLTGSGVISSAGCAGGCDSKTQDQPAVAPSASTASTAKRRAAIAPRFLSDAAVETDAATP